MRHSYVNAALWSTGNGLTGTTLISYLGSELGASWLAVGVLLASPQLVGVLRLSAPAMIARSGSRKRLCLWCYAASGVLLLLLPILSAPGRLPSREASLTALVLLWCGYHLCEYLGTIALWAWLADLVPGRVRGRFIGRRERWLLVGRIIGMATSGLFSHAWIQHHEESQHWIGYATAAAAGAVMMILAILPLLRMPEIATSTAAVARDTLRQMWAPLVDVRFRRLLTYGCCVSVFNGITQLAQFLYVRYALGISLRDYLLLQIALRLGQSMLAPLAGRLADRFGNRPLMIPSQLLVAVALLFYYAATPAQPGWIAGAWIFWVAYVGLNVCIPNLMLKLAPGENTSPHISAFYAIKGLFFGLSTILGGWLFGVLEQNIGAISFSPLVSSHYDLLFLVGFVLRAVAVVFLLRIVEPGARGLWELVFTRRKM